MKWRNTETRQLNWQIVSVASATMWVLVCMAVWWQYGF